MSNDILYYLVISRDVTDRRLVSKRNNPALKLQKNMFTLHALFKTIYNLPSSYQQQHGNK